MNKQTKGGIDWFSYIIGRAAAGGGGGSGGGGSSSIMTGTFTPTTVGAVESTNTGYTGDGYPVAGLIVVNGGLYNTANTDWVDFNIKGVTGMYAFTAYIMDVAPTYNGDLCVALSGGKSGRNNAVGSWGGGTPAIFTQDDPSSTSSVAIITMPNKNTIKYYVSDSGVGWLPGTTYRYWIIYSE